MAAISERSRPQLLAGLVALTLLVLGAYIILAPFLVSITWAAILAYATWPLHRRVQVLLGGRAVWSAITMTVLVILAIALPLTLLSLALADDVANVVRTLRVWANEPPDLPTWAAELPFVGPSLVGWHAALGANPGTLQRLLVESAPRWSQAVFSAAGDVGRNLVRLAVTLLTIFFLYRHGEAVLTQTRRVMNRFTGEEVQRRLEVVGATVRAVCYGVLLTAVAQGVLAGLGFWAAGLKASVLLGALTALLALLPFGPPLVWVPAGLWLLANDAVGRGIGLLLWGLLAVSLVDNVLRPYFIGGRTQIPFLLLLFGVAGGLAAFGLLGLFIGPTILAVLLVLWREWAVAPLTDGNPSG